MGISVHGAGTEFDRLLSELFLDPHPLLHEIRARTPIFFSDKLNSWVLTRYDDVCNALRDSRLSVVEETKRIDALPDAERPLLAPLRDIFEGWGGRSKEQDHARFLKLLKRHFTPQAVRQLLPRIQEIMDELVAHGLARGELDVVNDIAHPLAMTVVSELTGVPTDRMEMLLRCSNQISGLLEMGEREQLFACQSGMLELCEHLRPVVELHRREPRTDLIGILADSEEHGVVYTNEQIVSQCIMFLVVGYHTTANLLCNGLELLFEHPEQRHKLENRAELLPNAFDEMMRFHGPVASVRRLALVDFSIRDVAIRAGDTLVLALLAANRDPDVFSEPDRFDVERREANQQVGFTIGAYSCMGQALARLEGQVFFRTLLSRLPQLRPQRATPDWVPFRPLGRELRTLPVAFD